LNTHQRTVFDVRQVHCVPKKEDTKLITVTPSNLNHFQNSFTDRYSSANFQ